MLHSNAELQFKKTWWGNTGTGNCFINVVSANPPDKLNTVIKIEMNKQNLKFKQISPYLPLVDKILIIDK